MKNYAGHTSTRPPQPRHIPPTPQTQPLKNSTQVKNAGGGYGWQINDWQRLERFLILGTEGGTYYVSEKALTKDSAQAVMRCIAENGRRVVQLVVEVSVQGRAPKNDEALFVLAMCVSFGDTPTRSAAFKAFPSVVRTGTHLFHFTQFVNAFRGWGRGLRSVIGRWYNEMPVDKLAYQIVKYQQRDGWSHRDVLRLAHPKPNNDGRQGSFMWASNGWNEIGSDEPVDGTKLIWVYEKMKKATTEQDVISLIQAYKLTFEFVPSQWLGSAAVWRTLLPNLPMNALLRNLGRLTANGVLKPMSKEQDYVLDALSNAERIRRSRMHPLNILVAAKTYSEGRGSLGSLSWEPNHDVVRQLDSTFRLAFGNVPVTNQRLQLALDVSGSMTASMVGMPSERKKNKGRGLPLTSREASAALALITMSVEQKRMVTGFSAGGTDVLNNRRNSGISQLAIHQGMSLGEVCNYTASLDFGATDCALPMLYALEKGLSFDAFIIFTDSETNASSMHPSVALKQYRERTGINAKMIVVAMESDGYTIADPNDAGMLDVVGFDLATPQVWYAFLGAEKSPGEDQDDGTSNT